VAIFLWHILGSNIYDSIGNSLDFGIQRDTSVGLETDDELRSSFGSVTILELSFLQSTVKIALRISVGDRRVLLITGQLGRCLAVKAM
jgi:hypothetical protein